MKWIAISGSWRNINDRVKNDVRSVIKKIYENGDGIISGGALGVDYCATDAMLKLDKTKIKLFIPTELETYKRHYLMRAEEKCITKEDTNALIKQLKKIKSLGRLTENTLCQLVDEKSYFSRTCSVIDCADELIAFHVNNSKGTQDAINQAKKKGIPVKIFRYTVK